MSYQAIESPLVSGLSVDRNIIGFRLPNCSPELVAQVFETLGEHGINVDVIIYQAESQGGALSFTCQASDAPQVSKALADPRLASLADHRRPSLTDIAKVSVVGLGMQHSHGVAGRVFVALKEEDIPVLMISTSEIKISCVIASEHVERASSKLHRTLIEAIEPSRFQIDRGIAGGSMSRH